MIGSNYKVYKYQKKQMKQGCRKAKWIAQRNRYGVRIAVGPTGYPWVINNLGNISTPVKNSATGKLNWTTISGRARDIGVGLDGSVWIIGRNRVKGGYSVMKMAMNRKGRVNWDVQPGMGGVRISVDDKGNPWIVTDKRAIYHLRDGKWKNIRGSA